MIVTDKPYLVLGFLRDKGVTIQYPGSCVTIGYLNSEGDIILGVAFYNASSSNIYADGALDGGHAPHKFVRLCLWYAFGQLKVKRLTFMVAASNIKSINLVEKLGAYREATLQDGCSEEDQHIYCLRPERCPYWSILYGRRRRIST